MNKQTFLAAIRKRLSRLPRKEAEERLNFYSEMIDDRMEEGLTEAEATAAIGSVDAIAAEILSEVAAGKKEAQESKPRRHGFGTFLVVLGAPLWIVFLAVAFAVIVTVYAVLWSAVAVLWAVELPFLVLAVVAKYLLPCCRWATVATVAFTKKTVACTYKLAGGKRRISL